jgi:hypothetical protein
MTPSESEPPEPDDEREIALAGVAGGRALRVAVAALIAAAALLVGFAVRTQVHAGGHGLLAGLWVGAALLLIVGANGIRGLVRVTPGEAVVVQFLGRYTGSLRTPGLWWVNPWANRRRVSTKICVDETPVLKVNDTDGIPIEIAMVVNWRVTDTAKAVFVVGDCAQFVRSQAEMALRGIAARHSDHATQPMINAGSLYL